MAEPIHQTLWLEVERGRGFMAYPEGTPPLSINMKGYKAVHIYKYFVTSAGVTYPPVEITRWIAVFQQEWRKRRWVRHLALNWIRSRELGLQRRSLPQSYKLEQPHPSFSGSAAQ